MNDYQNTTKIIVCFTASFPYGTRETYFANELEYLANVFEKVILIPGYNPYEKTHRSLPDNVEVYNVVLKQGWDRVFDFFINFKIKKQHIKEFLNFKVYKDKIRFKKWVISVISYGKGYNAFKSYNFNEKEVILYSYWTGKNYFIEKDLRKFKKVVRMHGGDFYVERNSGYLPLIKEIYNTADLLLPISQDIYDKLLERYHVNSQKIHLSYLGVSNKAKWCTIKPDNKLYVISCSNVYPLKRIHLIYEILTHIDENIHIEWTHIGSGELLGQLKEYIDHNAKKNITVNFVGQKSQKELKEIYENKYFDFFINTSEYEGLPVSIMEAFSFSVPAVATNVGGTSEIVNTENGLLIDKDFNVEQVAYTIESFFLNNKLTSFRNNAYNTWKSKFNADNNYQKLIKKIKVL